MKKEKITRMAVLGLLTTMALILSYVESLLPPIWRSPPPWRFPRWLLPEEAALAMAARLCVPPSATIT